MHEEIAFIDVFQKVIFNDVCGHKESTIIKIIGRCY